MNPRFEKSYLIAIDSDGCAFDGMSFKQRNIFIPEAIKTFQLEKVSSLYHEVAEEINLFSELRGINRFIALWCALKQTQLRSGNSVALPDLTPLEKLIESGQSLSQQSLLEQIKKTPAEILEKSVIWSDNVNKSVTTRSTEIPVFDGVKSCLDAASHQANLMVCSAATRETLIKEWSEAELEPFITMIAGQEFGPKSKQLSEVMELGDFDPTKVLMVGDALGDLQAAIKAKVKFFPIIPGQEVDSWQILQNKVIPSFLNHNYSSDTQEAFVNRFKNKLKSSNFELPSRIAKIH